jgi:hypothetical protein
LLAGAGTSGRLTRIIGALRYLKANSEIQEDNSAEKPPVFHDSSTIIIS